MLTPLAPFRSFLDWSVTTDPGAWPGATRVVCGIPISEPYPGQPHPNDQSHAPNAIREESFQFCDGAEHWDFDLGGPASQQLSGRNLDIGNFVWDGQDYPTFLRETAQSLESLWEQGTRIFALGGDHGASIPLLQALKGVGEPVHIVHIDAHLDWRDEVQGVRHGYSSPLRRASEMPWVDGMTQIGLRGTGSARSMEVEAAKRYGSQLITARQFHAEGLDCVRRVLPRDVPFYITIDADGLDPATMPGVMAPSPGGLTARQVFDLIAEVGARGTLVGMDVVEVAPAMDYANKLSCILAGRLLMQGMLAARR